MRAVSEGVIQGEPARRHAEKVKDKHGDEKGGKRLSEHGERRHDGVNRLTTPPRDHDAEQCPQQKGGYGGNAGQKKRPGQCLTNEIVDGGWELAVTDSEVEMKQIVQVSHVFDRKRLVLEIEYRPQRVQQMRIGLQLGLIAPPKVINWIARQKARKQKIDSDGSPKRYQIESQAPGQIGH